MRSYKQGTNVKSRNQVIEQIEKVHPLKMINCLLIAASCLVFAIIIFFFIRHLAYEAKVNEKLLLPDFFVISTFILLASYHFSSRLINDYMFDAITELRIKLSYILISAVLFFLSQSIAWMEILQLDMIYSKGATVAYLFILCGLHFVFVMVGIARAALLFYKYMLVENDPVKTLITTTNPVERVKLEVFQDFWNFNILSWTLLFLLFLFVF